MIPEALKLPLTREIKQRAMEEAAEVGRRYREGEATRKPRYAIKRDPMQMARGFMSEIVLGRFLHLERRDPMLPVGTKRQANLLGSQVGWKDIEIRTTEHPDDSSRRGSKSTYSEWTYMTLSLWPGDYRLKSRAFVFATVWTGDVTSGDEGWVKYWGWTTGNKMFFEDGMKTLSRKDGTTYKLAGEVWFYDLDPIDEVVAQTAPSVYREHWIEGTEPEPRLTIAQQKEAGLRPLNDRRRIDR